MRMSAEPQEMLISLLFLALEECAVHSTAEKKLFSNFKPFCAQGSLTANGISDKPSLLLVPPGHQCSQIC